MIRRTALLALGLIGGGTVAVLVATGSATGTTGPQPFNPKGCTSGYVEGGVVDSWDGAASDLTVQQARANAETAMLRPDVVATATADLTADEQDRKVWTYHDASGASVAEVVLERAGNGWRLAGTQQCAPEGVAKIQENAPDVTKTAP
jgi:hypothetical protein